MLFRSTLVARRVGAYGQGARARGLDQLAQIMRDRLQGAGDVRRGADHLAGLVTVPFVMDLDRQISGGHAADQVAHAEYADGVHCVIDHDNVAAFAGRARKEESNGLFGRFGLWFRENF